MTLAYSGVICSVNGLTVDIHVGPGFKDFALVVVYVERKHLARAVRMLPLAPNCRSVDRIVAISRLHNISGLEPAALGGRERRESENETEISLCL